MTPLRRLPESVTTDRMVLRLWQPGDGPVLVHVVGQSLDHLRPWMPWVAAEPVSVAEREQWIEGCRADWSSGGDATYGVFLRDDGRAIGGTGLHRRGAVDELEIGYWLHPAHTGHGLATELTAALTTVAFVEAGVARVVVQHDRANRRSAGVPRRLGFTETGERSRPVVAPGECGIVVTWTVDQHEWDTVAGRRRGTMGTWHSSPSSTDPT